MRNALVLCLALGAISSPAIAQDAPIPHDAEYYILESQLAEQWAKDDAAVDDKLAQFRQSNGGKPPNVLYVLIDDLGFGDSLSYQTFPRSIYDTRQKGFQVSPPVRFPVTFCDQGF